MVTVSMLRLMDLFVLKGGMLAMVGSIPDPTDSQQTDTWTHRRTDRHTNTQTHKHTHTQTHRHTDTQTHKHTGTQTPNNSSAAATTAT